MSSIIDYFSINPVFYVFAFVAVVFAVMMITRKNPITSAIFLVLTFFCLSVVYVTLEAEFIAVIQVLVYAGAIMVLFLFVIMLLNLGKEGELKEYSGPFKYIAILIAFAIMVQIGLATKVSFTIGQKGNYPIEKIRALGNTELLSKVLLTDYLYAFEVAAVLLLLALVGAVVISKK